MTEGAHVTGRLPDGVVLRGLHDGDDPAGRHHELHDDRWGLHADALVSAHVFTILPGRAKGWGRHERHDDRYALLRGAIEVVLYDARPASPTAGAEARIAITESERSLLIIPTGVWHATRNVGEREALVVDMPTEPYDHGNPDKWTLPLDTDLLPVELGPEWVGY